MENNDSVKAILRNVIYCLWMVAPFAQVVTSIGLASLMYRLYVSEALGIGFWRLTYGILISAVSFIDGQNRCIERYSKYLK